MNEDKQDRELQIDLWKLLQLCLEKWWVIALFALSAAMLTLIYTAKFVTPPR